MTDMIDLLQLDNREYKVNFVNYMYEVTMYVHESPTITVVIHPREVGEGDTEDGIDAGGRNPEAALKIGKDVIEKAIGDVQKEAAQATEEFLDRWFHG